ncbi:hypothetical protein [Verrucosispora sp. TAA-831]|uniref:hypothetical protein n=1 Tax=Verrucosispora sp. TAA-831 TaxID=3422227 RepID=UPI003D6F2CB3
MPTGDEACELGFERGDLGALNELSASQDADGGGDLGVTDVRMGECDQAPHGHLLGSCQRLGIGPRRGKLVLMSHRG